MSKKKTHEEYVSELAVKNPNVEVIDKYINAITPIWHKCKIDGYQWKATPNNILRGHGCPICYGNVLKTTEQYVSELSIVNSNIEVIEQYINAKTPIRHRCKIDGYEWNIAPTNTLKGEGCPQCRDNMLHNKFVKTTKQYKEELNKINPMIDVLGEYIDAKTPILHKCLIDEYEWMIRPDNVLQGNGCPKCSNHIRRSHEDYVMLLNTANPDIDVIEQYVDVKTPILHYCKKHNIYWYVTPATALYGSGCPRCHESKGEKCVASWLFYNHIEYYPQYKFNDCKDIKPLPFDFYLPYYNVCIEYDGGQHYKAVDWAGKGNEHATQRLKVIQHHDAIKTKYCEDNNIYLLRIPYFANIEEELEKFFIHLI